MNGACTAGGASRFLFFQGGQLMFQKIKQAMQREKATLSEERIDPDRIPQHIAIIMDGNGRWAKQRHLPRVAGHKQGMQTVKTITQAASDLGVKVLTLYAFSTENWKRPNQEVNYLMQLPITFFNTFVPDLIKNNVKVQVMGDITRLPEKTQQAVNDAIQQTAHCTGMVLNFALNYGARHEIVQAVKQIAQAVQAGELTTTQIDEGVVAKHLQTNHLALPDPDLLIRTSGEERISNFLLWQIAYSELVFQPVMWPEYTAADLNDAIKTYQKRDRRYGGVKA